MKTKSRDRLRPGVLGAAAVGEPTHRVGEHSIRRPARACRIDDAEPEAVLRHRGPLQIGTSSGS